MFDSDWLSIRSGRGCCKKGVVKLPMVVDLFALAQFKYPLADRRDTRVFVNNTVSKSLWIASKDYH